MSAPSNSDSEGVNAPAGNSSPPNPDVANVPQPANDTAPAVPGGADGPTATGPPPWERPQPAPPKKEEDAFSGSIGSVIGFVGVVLAIIMTVRQVELPKQNAPPVNLAADPGLARLLGAKGVNPEKAEVFKTKLTEYDHKLQKALREVRDEDSACTALIWAYQRDKIEQTLRVDLGASRNEGLWKFVRLAPRLDAAIWSVETEYPGARRLARQALLRTDEPAPKRPAEIGQAPPPRRVPTADAR